MDEIQIAPRLPELFEPVIGRERTEGFSAALASARQRLAGHAVWHVNSTATGGGVAEMLQSVLSYPAGADIDVRWLVANGNDEFFEVTKRIHHLLHGSEGDQGPLGDEERAVYEAVIGADLGELLQRVQPGDVAILHDPQTLGFVPGLAKVGVPVIWSCHVGADVASDESRRAWRFLSPYVESTALQVFSRPAYSWEGLDDARVRVVPPCIDVFSAKNESLDDQQVRAILAAAGVITPAGATAEPSFERASGEQDTIERRVKMIEDEPVCEEAAVVCQISRWDPLKDHLGIMEAFVDHVPAGLGAELILAGPSPESVSDDPEGQGTLDELISHWRALPPEARRRIHICCVPMDDTEENAAMINALQRRADVLVQKSLAEGFGLTVAEAMWKGRPTLGSRVGGIQDQITDGVSGVLVDPEDPREFADAVVRLLSDREAAARMGEAARQQVAEEYLAPTYLSRQFALVEEVLAS